MKFYIHKLGCPKNDVDADILGAALEDSGMVASANVDEADLVIVNTCGFIEPAKEESIETILRYERDKRAGKLKKLFVAGCLSQRYGQELFDEIDGLDGVFGLGQVEKLVAAVAPDAGRVLAVSDDVTGDLLALSGRPRRIEDDRPYAYLKIADGCNRFCSYCAIPNIRGRYRSRRPEQIIAEAEFLAERGKRELILVSQEGTGYGRDFENGPGILELLPRLEQVEGIEWIRLMYLHPAALTDAMIDYMSASEKVLGYFDLPLQHICDRMLKLMNRPVSRREIEEKLLRIRQASVSNIIRTTLIVGFPGERDDDFRQLREFVEKFGFDRLGVFGYSCEEGTSACDLPDSVPDEVIEERHDDLMRCQQEIAFRKNIDLIDSIQSVIIDEVPDGHPAVGRTAGDCPDIDQTVFVRDANLVSGRIVDCKIVMADGYDLIGEVADPAP